ncbi:hypothetical protein [uncultured Cetobacterium sp.]|uniref:hypothetical protein n=1 Tax=uncultured Cetobacterium sp. TaxID=527638 RepID=UPI002639438A|nr:hypothetical protein [uncultured Cetobacterium sp.]
MFKEAEIYLKIIGMIAAAFFAYHKFIMAQLDKKVDKESCQKETEYREKLQKESNKTIYKMLAEVKDELNIIKTYILQNKN